MIALLLAAVWVSAAPLPQARTEVAAAALRGEVAIVGGLTSDGASPRVDAYSPATDSWRRLPDLPAGRHHAFAASDGRRLYVAGGYGDDGPTRTAWFLDGVAWRSLPPLPEARAAGGAAVLRGKLYIVAGRGPTGLARRAYSLDLATRRWRAIPPPTPREHLAVAAAGGKIHAVGGRQAGYDTNLANFESWTPGAKSWTRLTPLPTPRGGIGAAAVRGSLVSVGGEAPSGTIRTVYAYGLATKHWRRLPDLPTPRHGLSVAAVGTRVYAIAGGPQPGLTVSDANEHIDLS